MAAILAGVVLSVLATAFPVSGQIGIAGFGDGKGEVIAGTTAVMSDIKYIKCDVCNLVAKHAYRQAKALEKNAKLNKKVSEIDIIEKLEKIADPDQDEGEWVASIDLVEDGDRLLVKEMDNMGKCGYECKTVRRAAEQVVEGIDTDMAEKLWKGNISRSQFTNWLCHEETSSCTQKPPKLPADRPKGEDFVESDPEEAKMQKMMSKMKEMGMAGQMFSREQAQKYADGEDEDDYGDDSNPAPAKPAEAESAEEGETNEEDEAKEPDDKDEEGTPVVDFVNKASSSAQAVVDKAVETAKDGWESAKQTANDLIGKAQDLLGAEKEDKADEPIKASEELKAEL